MSMSLQVYPNIFFLNLINSIRYPTSMKDMLSDIRHNWMEICCRMSIKSDDAVILPMRSWRDRRWLFYIYEVKAPSGIRHPQRIFHRKYDIRKLKSFSVKWHPWSKLCRIFNIYEAKLPVGNATIVCRNFNDVISLSKKIQNSTDI